ncbi:hypothetical protein [Streptomyces sp. NBC_01190]|uniref:hypothetical protein n=1 Tax=Streptomyces sp. NBC_01190 TaxID=2903767 RepID=UPI00386D66BA|nr:hypothetical protein OG519_21385 [Streptomyces sp. NBC_01190]
MTEGPGQQPPQDPRSTAPEGGREILEGRVIPSRSQAQRQYDAPPPRQPQPQDDPRQQFAAPPPAAPGAGAAPQAPGAGPAWSTQEPQQGPRPGQPGPDAGPRGQAAQQAPQAPQAPQHAQGPRQSDPGPQDQQPGQGFSGQAAAFQQRIQQIREAAAAEEANEEGAARGAGAKAARAGKGSGAGAPPKAPGSHRASGGPRSGPGTPDWSALADEQAAGARRRKVMMLTGGIVAVAVIAGGVATAVVLSGKSSDSAAGPTAAASTAGQPTLPPAPSFSSVAPPPPANPLDYIGTAAKDKAPLTADSLFPGKQFVLNGRTYVKTAAVSTANCESGARDAVATALAANGCHQLVRATYTNGPLAVTVGVAVFDDSARAAKVQHTARYLAPLNGGGVKDFCHAVYCQMTSNAVGRYAYFAISGYKNGKTLAVKDSIGRRAANEASNFAFQRIVQRGKDAAAADPDRG